MIAPLIDEIANDHAGKLVCLKLNTDESPGVAAEYGIRSIPTVMVFKGEQQLHRTAFKLLPATPRASDWPQKHPASFLMVEPCTCLMIWSRQPGMLTCALALPTWSEICTIHALADDDGIPWLEVCRLQCKSKPESRVTAVCTSCCAVLQAQVGRRLKPSLALCLRAQWSRPSPSTCSWHLMLEERWCWMLPQLLPVLGHQPSAAQQLLLAELLAPSKRAGRF
jgi:hypothetical protein